MRCQPSSAKGLEDRGHGDRRYEDNLGSDQHRRGSSGDEARSVHEGHAGRECRDGACCDPPVRRGHERQGRERHESERKQEDGSGRGILRVWPRASKDEERNHCRPEQLKPGHSSSSTSSENPERQNQGQCYRQTPQDVTAPCRRHCTTPGVTRPSWHASVVVSRVVCSCLLTKLIIRSKMNK